MCKPLSSGQDKADTLRNSVAAHMLAVGARVPHRFSGPWRKPEGGGSAQSKAEARAPISSMRVRADRVKLAQGGGWSQVFMFSKCTHALMQCVAGSRSHACTAARMTTAQRPSQAARAHWALGRGASLAGIPLFGHTHGWALVRNEHGCVADPCRMKIIIG
jgi:hypothetical protein